MCWGVCQYVIVCVMYICLVSFSFLSFFVLFRVQNYQYLYSIVIHGLIVKQNENYQNAKRKKKQCWELLRPFARS